MKKYLVVAVILLFIGLAVAPSINANVSKDALVEFTTEVCGLNGGKHTVKLTQGEADEVEVLFDSIRERLNTTKTREEAEEIFKEAVVELDNYGLLGGLSVKQAQRLVTGNFQIDNNKRISSRKIYEVYNLFCMLVAIATPESPGNWPIFIPMGPLFLFYLAIGTLFFELGLEIIANAIALLEYILIYLIPFRFLNIIIGLNYEWEIVSLGLKGLIKSVYYNLCLFGFTGIMIHSSNEFSAIDKYFLLGFCLAYYE